MDLQSGGPSKFVSTDRDVVVTTAYSHVVENDACLHALIQPIFMSPGLVCAYSQVRNNWGMLTGSWQQQNNQQRGESHDPEDFDLSGIGRAATVYSALG
jgi:hypothetical protein